MKQKIRIIMKKSCAKGEEKDDTKRILYAVMYDVNIE